MKTRLAALGSVACLATLLTALGGSTTASGATPTCFGERATIVGTKGPDILVGTAGTDVVAGKTGDDVIRGFGGDDLLCGGNGDDELVGGPGSDRLRGGDGNDDLFGAAGDDTVQGGGGGDLLLGQTGNDAFDGGDGLDTVSFLFAKADVTADLRAGTASGEGTDTLKGVEDAIGSQHDDVLTAKNGRSELSGESGNDVLDGRAGANVLEGGPGDDRLNGDTSDDDTASFVDATIGVAVDLQSGTASGGDGDGDALNAIEHVAGSGADDTIDGSEENNQLFGGLGTDRISGRDGNDFLLATFPGDYAGFGKSPNEQGDGGNGTDGCFGFETATDCEAIPVSAPPPTESDVTSPQAGSEVAVSSFTEANGEVGTFAGNPARVQVALRLFTDHGCRWWSPAVSRLVPRPCLAPRWAPATQNGDGTWRYAYQPGRPLPAGRYQLMSRALSGAYREPAIAGKNLIELLLTS
jgi:Ca2+-binding RTX toxin-like protein